MNPVKVTTEAIDFFFEQRRVERHSAWWLAVILALGILCAAASSALSSSQPLFTTDNGTWAIATNLVNGRGYSACESSYFPFCTPANQATAMREPLPVLLMALALLVSHSPYSGLIVQSLLYLGTALVIHSILKRKDARIALLAAFLWTVSVPVIREIKNDSGELAAAFFLSLGLFHFLKGRNERDNRHWILAGLFMGLASLSRTVLLGVSIGLGLMLLLQGLKNISQGWRKQLAPALLFLLAIGVVIAPWIIRNDIIFGQPVIGSTLTGYNIFRMNYIVAGNTFSPHYVGSTEGYIAIEQLIKKSNLTGLENEARMQNIYMKAGLEIILQHPLRYAGLSLYRFLPLWFNTSVDFAYQIKPQLMDYLAMLQQAFLLIAVTLSIGRNRRENWPFILTLILGSGAYMAIGAQLRYLVDFMPAVVILAAQAIPNPKFVSARSSRG
jgi:hypothetical protein